MDKFKNILDVVKQFPLHVVLFCVQTLEVFIPGNDFFQGAIKENL